jgi:uroporphyrinogen decarboxylase
MDTMSRRERVMAAVRGEETDRPPWGLWRHFYAAECTADQLAERMLNWVNRYSFDFLKVNPRAQYHVEIWDARYQYSGREHEKPERLDFPIKNVEDWTQLERRGLDARALAEQLAALQSIGDGLEGGTPYVETIFTPLAIAGYLVENSETLVEHLRARPDLVHAALETITETFAPFAAACIEAGADGIFLATTRWASRDYLTPSEYAEFGRPYDLRILKAVEGAAFNVLHVCDSHNMLADLADYPVQAFNWAATDPTNPTLADASVPGLRIGGLSAEALVAADPTRASVEARAIWATAGSRGWALAPDCSIPTDSRDENIRAAGRALGVAV